MEAHYRAFNGRLIIKVEGATIKDLFAQIGPVAEVLDGDSACGKCASPNIYPRVRTAQEKYDYYELVCSDCGARLSFGQSMDKVSLWPKRKDEDGNLMDHRGWTIYRAIAAPAQAPVNSTAQRPAARPAPAEDPRLADMLARCTKPDATNEVLAEVCSAIEGLKSAAFIDRLWADLTREHGEPENKQTAVKPVLSALLNALAAEEAKVRRTGTAA